MQYLLPNFLDYANIKLMHYYIQGQQIKQVTSANYLGVTIDECLTQNYCQGYDQQG